MGWEWGGKYDNCMSTAVPSTSQHNDLYSNVCGFIYPSDEVVNACRKEGDEPCPIEAEIVEKAVEGIKKHLSADGRVLNLYMWGSRFYKNSKKESDYDLVAIVTGTRAKREGKKLELRKKC